MLTELTRLLHQHPLVFIHLVTAFSALLLGGVVLARRKGTARHRALGWAWVALMGSTAVASGFIRDYHLPNLAGHRQTMRDLYIGACVLAGVFTLLPGRFLGQLLWHHGLGLV